MLSWVGQGDGGFLLLLQQLSFALGTGAAARSEELPRKPRPSEEDSAEAERLKLKV